MTMDALELLLGRESATRLEAPGPSQEALEVMFRSALRAPDHGRLRPWHFVVVPTGQRERFGEVMAQSMHRREPNATPEMLQRERDKALRAPVIVVAAARLRRRHKIPEVEQRASAAAAAQNILLAARAQGFAGMWKTGAPAYDPAVGRALGLGEDDEIVGFLYLGTQAGEVPPMKRPEPREHVTVWQG